MTVGDLAAGIIRINLTLHDMNVWVYDIWQASNKHTGKKSAKIDKAHFTTYKYASAAIVQADGDWV